MGNTVGSLSEVQHAIVIGSLLGDGSMRCKTNALLEINHSIHQRSYVDWKFSHLAGSGDHPAEAAGGQRWTGRVPVCDAKRSSADSVLPPLLCRRAQASAEVGTRF